MHTLEPFYNWRNLYTAETDEKSPFFGREYSEFEFTNKMYNYLIHPQWDDIGTESLYIKILYADYNQQFAIIELLGEWNDCITNDIMFFKRDIIDELTHHGINKFILIGENVLNFHYSDDSYYEEWFDDIEDGWIAFLNFRPHVLSEFNKSNIDSYILFGGNLNNFAWRTNHPNQLYISIDSLVQKRLSL